MKRLLTSLLLTICFFGPALAQDQDKKLTKAAANGSPVPTLITVGDSVLASAVLIPRVDARRIFGAEIANNYAVIEINVGNKSPDASLIIHGIFIDYSRWALRGGTGKFSPSDSVDPRYQSSTHPNHVASEEYRVVRGQFLDAKMWSKREWTMRLLTLAGSLAGGYSFSIKEEGILKGLEAFSGILVPGVKEAWPDSTIEQLNNISDFGFRTNRAIPKQGAEIIVGFFPIERFLTPGFRKLYLKSPALFFAPLQMLVDKKIQKDVMAALDLGLEEELADMRKKLPCYLSVAEHLDGKNVPDYEVCKIELEIEERTRGIITVIPGKEAKAFRSLNYLNAVSLNNVTVVIDGVMSVNSSAIAAKLDELVFDNAADCGNDESPCFWADTETDDGIRTGTIKGSYLTGGSIVIDEAAKLGITDLKTISENSDDQTLHFSFKLTTPIAAQKSLHFKITKPLPDSASGKTLDSNVREYLIHYPAPAPPVITEVNRDEPGKGKLTIKGTGFLPSPTYPLQVKLTKPDGSTMDAKVVSKHPGEIVIEMPNEPAGCWSGDISLGTSISAKQAKPNCFCFFIAPSPKIDSATIDGKIITVEGEDLIPTQFCDRPGPALSFQVSKGDKTAAFQVVGPVPFSGTEMILKLRPTAPDVDDTWIVKVLLDGKEIKENGTAAIQRKQ